MEQHYCYLCNQLTINGWVCDECCHSANGGNKLRDILAQELPIRHNWSDSQCGFSNIDPDLQVDDGF